MPDQPDKAFLRLLACGLITPFVRHSTRLRKEILRGVHYNTDMVTNQLSTIDLATDSLKERVISQRDFVPKGAFESGLMSLSATFQEYFGYKYVLPVAQGRTAELILASVLCKADALIPNNLLFITTRAHQELAGASLKEIPVPEAFVLQSDHPFKGNCDLMQLKQLESSVERQKIPYIFIETSVNASGGHPVSMANIRSVYELFKEYGIPIIIDACRILENAWFIREREPGYGARSLKDIVREFCSYANVCTMSATKDFYVDSGGFLATSNEELYHRFMDMIMIVGDGLSVRSKGILNRAISIPFDSEDVITKRVVKSKHLWKKLKRAGIPVVEPECGYGVFIDASPLHKYLQKEEYPEKSFLARLYLESGILGSENFLTPGQKKRDIKMLRFALPIRNYRLSDMDYVAKHVITVWEKADSIRGLRKTYEPPSKAGEFLAHYDLKTDSHMTS